jgi:heat-inducible transcriptional repressor
VFEGGHVENRLLELPVGVGSDALIRAGNFLSARLAGKTLDQARASISAEVNSNRAEIDRLTASIVEAGLATQGKDVKDGVLIVRGQSNLLKDVRQLEELHKVQTLFQALETKETMLKLLESTDTAEGIQIFIGEQTELFGLSGCSMILAPYQNQSNQVVGAVGVIGPMHMNYGRIIPMVDYTAQIVSRALGNASA